MDLCPKEDLVLIPGLGDDAALWKHQVRHLADIAVPRVADVSKSESIAELATEILDTAPPRFSLCGFSLGGYVALYIHRRAPERVVRLALIGTNARSDTDTRRSERIALLEKLQEPADFRRVLSMQLKQSVAPASLHNEAWRRLSSTWGSDWDPKCSLGSTAPAWAGHPVSNISGASSAQRW
jgi:pimeloyl-ACP methyl ester carboxylesterase